MPMRIKYDANLIKYISLFETLTRTVLKDCFEALDQLIFVVKEGEIAKAIGKNGSNVKKLERILNRKIKIVEFNPDVLEAIKNIIFPLKLKDIRIENKVVTLSAADIKTRGQLIGRNAQNLRDLEKITKRYFDITEIKVV